MVVGMLTEATPIGNNSHSSMIVQETTELITDKGVGGVVATVTNSIRNDFFGICIPLAYYFCMLPDILEKHSRTFKILYFIWTCFVYLLAIFCHLSQIYKLFQLFTDEYFIFDEVIRNYIITTYHFAALVRCCFLKGKVSGKIFKHVIKYENKIYSSQDTDVISVYNETVSSFRRTTASYLAGFAVVVLFYIAAPALRDPYIILKGNETIVIPQVPLSSWTPIDDQYWPAFIWTSAAGAYLTVFFVTTDLTCFSFIIFGICQIKVLKHFITNFHQYAKKISEKDKLNKMDSFRILQRECIIMHQEVISYVKELNGSLKKIMLLDFVPSSIQLAGVIYQMMTNLSIIQCILLGQFICSLIARIFIYCNSSHNLEVESQSLALAWYSMNWNELPGDVQKNMIICIKRSQKPLQITIGNFQNISLATFIMILKGAYSYMMLLTTL